MQLKDSFSCKDRGSRRVAFALVRTETLSHIEMAVGCCEFIASTEQHASVLASSHFNA
jgi:hypothetical protein